MTNKTKMRLFSTIISAGILATCTDALQFMMTERNKNYCFEYDLDKNAKATLDYAITGIAVEDHVVIDLYQQDPSGKKIGEQLDKKRNDILNLFSTQDSPLFVCFMKTDDAAKKVDFSLEILDKFSNDAADQDTLDRLKEKLEGLENYLETVSRNIGRQRDLEKEHFELAQSAASTQTYMSILKMIIVIGICFGQVYMITNHFSGSQNKRRQIDPFDQVV